MKDSFFLVEHRGLDIERPGAVDLQHAGEAPGLSRWNLERQHLPRTEAAIVASAVREPDDARYASSAVVHLNSDRALLLVYARRRVLRRLDRQGAIVLPLLVLAPENQSGARDCRGSCRNE